MTRGRPRAPWIKLWIDILSDPKLADFSLADMGLWAKLLLLASQSPVRGKFLLTPTLPMSISQIADALHLRGNDRKVLARQLPILIDRGMIENAPLLGQGANENSSLAVQATVYCITNWHSRQDVYPSDVANNHYLEAELAPNKLRISSDITPIEVEVRGKRKEVDMSTTSNEYAASDKPTAARLQPRRARNKTPDSRVSEIGKLLLEERGYASPAPPAEAKAASVMLGQGHDPLAILACYRYLKQEEFWRDKPLLLNSVAKNIGEWAKLGSPTKPREDRNNGKRPSGDTRRAQAVPGNRPVGAFADLAERDKDL